jgi:hypothetical protein
MAVKNYRCFLLYDRYLFLIKCLLVVQVVSSSFFVSLVEVSKGKKLDFVSLSDTVPAVLCIQIRIPIHLAVLDPDPDRYWECRIQEHGYWLKLTKSGFLPFKMLLYIPS